MKLHYEPFEDKRTIWVHSLDGSVDSQIFLLHFNIYNSCNFACQNIELADQNGRQSRGRRSSSRRKGNFLAPQSLSAALAASMTLTLTLCHFDWLKITFGFKDPIDHSLANWQWPNRVQNWDPRIVFWSFDVSLSLADRSNLPGRPPFKDWSCQKRAREIRSFKLHVMRGSYQTIKELSKEVESRNRIYYFRVASCKMIHLGDAKKISEEPMENAVLTPARIAGKSMG